MLSCGVSGCGPRRSVAGRESERRSTPCRWSCGRAASSRSRALPRHRSRTARTCAEGRRDSHAMLPMHLRPFESSWASHRSRRKVRTHNGLRLGDTGFEPVTSWMSSQHEHYHRKHGSVYVAAPYDVLATFAIRRILSRFNAIRRGIRGAKW